MKVKTMIIRDNTTGMGLFSCSLNDRCKVSAKTQIETYPLDRKLNVSVRISDGSCNIFYNTGDSYSFEKNNMQMQGVHTGMRDDGGNIRSTPMSLESQLNAFVSSFAGTNLTMDAFYELPASLQNKARQSLQDFQKMLVEEVQFNQSLMAVPFGIVIRNYLCDGGLAVYHAGDKTLAVCLYRIGAEFDYAQGVVVSEYISGEPFGSASYLANSISSGATWGIPYYGIMEGRGQEDLSTFMSFMESVNETGEFTDYRNRLHKETSEIAHARQIQTVRAENAMWSQAFAAQQSQFAAMDRLSASIKQDLNSFHDNLFQQMNQNDMRFYNQPGSGLNTESYDDRIQRMRHESMMDVETYEREDGTTVEYDNRADRVFESNLENTSHFGTKNYYDDFVPEGWHELKKKQ